MTFADDTDFNGTPLTVTGARFGTNSLVVKHGDTTKTKFQRRSLRLLFAGLIALIATLHALVGLAGSDTPVVVVSAASFDPTQTVAAESIVAAFGKMLATQEASATIDADPALPGFQLPTTLGGTTLEVNGRTAELFFVSPVQVNFLIPRQTEIGTAQVTVRSGDGTISQGTVQVSAVAPAVFTASSTGKGVPAGSHLRVKANGERVDEPLFSESLAPIPIDLGPEGDQVFLVLYLTGIRGASDADLNHDGNFNETVHILIDGQEIVPDYAGNQNSFAGLDQINARIPRNLIGRGIVSLGVVATGFGAANVTVLEIGGAPPAARPEVNGFGPTSVLAGEELTITGTGFSSNPTENKVALLDQEAQATVAPVISSSTTQIKVRVPFGTGSGRVMVTVDGSQGNLTGLSTDSLSLITSISGIIQDDHRQPIAGATMRVPLPGNQSIEARTNAEGSFILGNVPSGFIFLDVDTGTIPGGLFPRPVPLKMNVKPNRDNLLKAPIELKSVSTSGSATSLAATARKAMTVRQNTGATLEIPGNAVVQFPDGTTGGDLTLSTFAVGRTPVTLPVGHFSSSIVQITPFGATITPGARLTFPNSDQLPAGSQATLFRFDQNPVSPTLGTFVDAGFATVSADGQRVVTDANAITETSYYFVSILRPTATLLGRVLDSDGRPLRLAIVQGRGQATFTDGLGGFALRSVPVIAANDQVTLDVSFLRANGRVDRSQLTNFPLIPGGISQAVAGITLPSPTSNRSPVIFAPATISANQGQTRDFTFVASDPDPGQTVEVTVTGAAFATIIPGGNTEYQLRVAPGPSDGGLFTLTLTATDNLGAKTMQNISLRVNRLPTANAQSVSTSAGAARAITLTGSDADGDDLSFMIVTAPLHGALSGEAPILTYTPAANYSGLDSFSFKVSDGLAESNLATVSITVNSPAPTITSIDPTAVTAGGSSLTLTVNGSGFVSNSVVRWNGSNRATSFVNATRVTAQILLADIASAGTASVTVFNAAPGGGTSAGATFTINNPIPTTSSLDPASASTGSAGFTLTVNGTGFVSNSIVRWNGSDRATTFVNAGRVTAQISGSDIGSPGTASVTVFSPSPGGGTSNGLSFSINNPIPAVNGLNPTSASAGGSGFTLTVNGTGFVSNSVVRWNGSDRATTFVTPGQLTAQIPDGDIVSAGTADVTVFSPSPGGGISNGLGFSIDNPTPTANSLDPSSAGALSPGFTLTVNGTGFSSSSVVRWNGSNRSTTFIHGGQLSAQIPGSDLASSGTANVTVFSPSPGGGTSNALIFTINNPIPAAFSLNPDGVSAGGPGFTLTVNGSGFVSNSVVRWNGGSRVTTFVHPGQLMAQIPDGDIASTGSANITVFSPGPGGGTSNQLTLPITNPVPVLNSLNPNSAIDFGPDMMVTVHGTGFVASSVVRWNGSNRVTTFVSSTQLNVIITSMDRLVLGMFNITVFNPGPGGGTSNPQTFTIYL